MIKERCGDLRSVASLETDPNLFELTFSSSDGIFQISAVGGVRDYRPGSNGGLRTHKTRKKGGGSGGSGGAGF
jgi:hypothetical protein